MTDQSVNFSTFVQHANMHMLSQGYREKKKKRLNKPIAIKLMGLLVGTNKIRIRNYSSSTKIVLKA